MNPRWEPENIFSDRSLWSIYWLSYRVLPKSKFNEKVFVVALIFLILIQLRVSFLPPESYGIENGLSILNVAADRAFYLSVGVLGFLIAGFAIFASMTKVGIFVSLSKIRYEKSEISRLQYVFFNFLNVFTIYILLLSLSMAITLVFNGEIPIIVVFVGENRGVVMLVICFMNVIIGMCIVASVLRLKSFIWNLYQTILVAIAAESELQQHK